MLRLEHIGVHPGHDLPGSDGVAFVHQDLPDPTRNLGGDVDIGRLDASIAARETFREALRLERSPRKERGTGHEQHHNGGR